MLKSSSAARACSPGLAARGTGLAAILILLASPCEAALTGADRLFTVYESILAARFDRADAQLTQTCPPAPEQACRALAAVSVWWQIQIDPDNRGRDGLLTERARAAVNGAAAWT